MTGPYAMSWYESKGDTMKWKGKSYPTFDAMMKEKVKVEKKKDFRHFVTFKYPTDSPHYNKPKSY